MYIPVVPAPTIPVVSLVVRRLLGQVLYDVLDDVHPDTRLFVGENERREQSEDVALDAGRPDHQTTLQTTCLDRFDDIRERGAVRVAELGPHEQSTSPYVNEAGAVLLHFPEAVLKI